MAHLRGATQPVGEARRDALHWSFALSYGRAMFDRLFALQRVLTLASIMLEGRRGAR
jgi:hypothetical protein